MGSTFVLVVQAGKEEVVVVDMKTRVGVGVDTMQIVVVDWEQRFPVEAHNHPVENSNWESPNSENTDFLLVGAEGQVMVVEEKCDSAAVEVVAGQNLIEVVVVEGMVCTTPCPSEFHSTEP